MKIYIVTGFYEGDLAFSFNVNCYNSFQAIQQVVQNESVLYFDKLIVKELK